MKLTDIRDFYAQSANIVAPWKVVEVEICAETRSVEVRVECEGARRGRIWRHARERTSTGGASGAGATSTPASTRR